MSQVRIFPYRISCDEVVPAKPPNANVVRRRWYPLTAGTLIARLYITFTLNKLSRF